MRARHLISPEVAGTDVTPLSLSLSLFDKEADVAVCYAERLRIQDVYFLWIDCIMLISVPLLLQICHSTTGVGPPPSVKDLFTYFAVEGTYSCPYLLDLSFHCPARTSVSSSEAQCHFPGTGIR